jgi:adenosylcobinamide-GDP ribazoletransferase
MTFRGLLLATQFLTRLPVPATREYSEREMSSSAWWFPLIGAAVGCIVALAVFVGSLQSPWLAAVLGVITWTWITGAMHLDGLADLSDALGASHGDPRKFFAVLADPHVGTFGVVSIVSVLLLKFVLIAELPRSALLALVLIPAWARLGTLAWTRWLPSLKGGRARQLADGLPLASIVGWTVLLLAASAFVAPVLLLAPAAIAAWGIWLRARLGGVTGDCLGAGVEITEVLMLVAARLGADLHLSLGTAA